jgi:putative ATP-dependent endonuclease of the OLD family
VAPLANVVVLRHITNEGHTVGRSLKKIKLGDEERKDLERYIDATRGELFFSKAVILVEGDAEKFLLPTLAKLYDQDLDFDAMGISICSISGTNFAPYIQLLGPKGLDIPFVVLTDFDPKNEDVSQEDADPDDEGVSDSYGKNRVVNQIMKHILDEDVWEKSDYAQVLKLAPKHGVFLNTFTFEIDVFKAGAEGEFLKAVEALTSNKKMHDRFSTLSADPASLNPEKFLKDIDSIGKGRVAQRLASVLIDENVDVCPPYIKAALDYLKAGLG